MGVYLTYYVEYRDNANDKWHLASALVPKEKYSCYNNTKSVCFGEKEFCIANSDSIQGHIRDVFSTHGRFDTSFTGRGFPEDMSDELKEFIHEMELKAFEEDRKYIDTDKEWKLVDGVLKEIPRTTPVTFENDFQDWKYDKTWATLSELSTFSDKQVLKAEQRIKDYKDKDSFAKLEEHLKAIEDVILSGDKTKFVKQEVSETNDDYYDSEYESELYEALEDARFFEQWVYGLRCIADFCTGSWNDYDNIRIIAYLS